MPPYHLAAGLALGTKTTALAQLGLLAALIATVQGGAQALSRLDEQRFDVMLQAGESNYTELGVETGLAGALLFIAWNLALLASLVRARRAALAAMLAAVLFVAIQTDAYGIPWLAYCVWWLGASGLRYEHRSPR